MKKEEMSKYIDHTVLKASASESDVIKLCNEALENNFAAVCVNPCWVPVAHDILKGSKVNVCTVVGFPLGANPTKVKEFETEWALDHGATEIDMVINVGWALSEDWQDIENEIASLAEIVHKRNASLKVIFETCYLNKHAIEKVCHACVNAEADYVKTSTGFGTDGATLENVKLMAEAVAGKCKVKASGGVRNAQQAMEMINAGASRLGTSSGISIIAELNE